MSETAVPSSYHVVVARYQENIDWLSRYDPASVIIYNKDSKPCVCPYKVIDVPNVGREAHTYLTYIVDHYDCLPEVVFFTQGKIDDHPHCVDVDFINIPDFSKNYVHGSFFQGLSSDGRIHHYRGIALERASLKGADWFRTYITPEVDMKRLNMWHGAIFSVKRHYILSRPRETYQQLLTQFQSHNSPEAAHFIERAWFYLFNCHREHDCDPKESTLLILPPGINGS